jgi:hypothetical protein
MKKQVGYTHMYILVIQSRNALSLNQRQESEPNLLNTEHPDIRTYLFSFRGSIKTMDYAGNDQ